MAPSRAQLLIARAEAELKQTRLGYKQLEGKPSGHWAQALKLLGQASAAAGPPPKPPAPKLNLGPIVKGGVSILLQDLTHVTDGMDAGGSVWPALDDGVGHPGLAVLAPEALTITGHGHAKRRDGKPDGLSINIAVGASKLEYWIGHLADLLPVGTKVRKGQQLATISSNHEAPHVHLGINAIPLLGHDLAHHDNYTHGAPKIGAQLLQASL